MKSEKTRNLFWLVVGVLLFATVIYAFTAHEEELTSLLVNSGPWAILISLILYPLLAPTPITTDPITVVISVAYGPFVGVLVAFIGNTLAALFEYYIGKKVTQVSNLKKEKLPCGLSKLPVDSIVFLILGRMIPGYGSKIISLLAGAYKVPIKRYLWTTAVTNLLGALMMAYGGFSLIQWIK